MIIRTIEVESRHRPENAASFDTSSEDELVITPSMIRTTLIIRSEGSVEIGMSADQDLITHTDLVQEVEKGSQALIQTF